MKKLILLLLIIFITVDINANESIFNCSLETLCTEKGVDKDAVVYFFEENGIDINEAKDLSLYINVFKWLYTPYRLGGKTENGIDCSAYVSKLLNATACYESYTNSKGLVALTDYVDSEELQEGDLVFFNVNGGGISHVGIYLQNGKFSHASSSKGVIVSSLNEEYWSKRFCRTGRLKSN